MNAGRNRDSLVHESGSLGRERIEKMTARITYRENLTITDK